MNNATEKRKGVAYGLSAFLSWGLIPLYFKIVADVPALEVLAHRILWSLVFLLIIIVWRGRWSPFLKLFKDWKTLAILSGTTVFIAANWLVFIWAVFHDRLWEASLGYFINPLVSVTMGVIFLRERLRKGQVFAVVLAGVGVTYLAVGNGSLPWVAIVLALSFGSYGLLRKIAKPDAIMGLTVETVILAPLAVGWLVWNAGNDTLAFIFAGWEKSLWLLAAGPLTALPLLWFTEGARRLRLATLGFLQYLAPSMQFLLAVLVFGEPFGKVKAISFGLIWAALLLYSIDTARSLQKKSLRKN